MGEDKMLIRMEKMATFIERLIQDAAARDAEIADLKSLVNTLWDCEMDRRGAEIATHAARLVHDRDARGIVPH